MCALTLEELHSGCVILHPQQQGLRFLSCSTASPPLGIITFLNFSRSSRCEVVSPSGFNSPFLGKYWCKASFHLLMDHLCIFYEGSVQIFRSVRLFTLLLSCQSPLFLLCCGLAFHFLSIVFEQQKFLIQMKSNLKVFSCMDPTSGVIPRSHFLSKVISVFSYVFFWKFQNISFTLR